MENAQTNTRREITTEVASELSGLSRSQITNLLRQGKLEGRNYGHRLWMVYADSLERYLATPRKSGPKGPRKKKPKQATGDVAPTENGSHNS